MSDLCNMVTTYAEKGKTLATSLATGLGLTGVGAAAVVVGVITYNVVFKEETTTPAIPPSAEVTQPQETAIAEPVAAPQITPSFDVVRIDKEGAAVVAGKAAPNSKVIVGLDGQEIATAQSDSSGSFVALFDLPPATEPRELSLIAVDKGGVELASADQVLVVPTAVEQKTAPKVVVAKADGVEVIKPKAEKVQNPDAPAPDTPLSLDTIVYDDVGDVIVAGSGKRDEFIRVYLDNKPKDVQKVQKDGGWKITLSDVPEGIYALRVDTVDAQGKVQERIESPFKKETPKTVVASSKSKAANVTVQPGFTLWELAENQYGSGTRFVQIFEANRDIIKDPDLIYPGQIFDLPTQ